MGAAQPGAAGTTRWRTLEYGARRAHRLHLGHLTPASVHRPEDATTTREPQGTRDELRPATRAALVRGCELYTGARYFEAHEAWEVAWLAEAGEVRLLLHGLILVAAGFVKAFRDGRPAGAVKHLEAAARKLEALPADMAGVGLAQFRDELAQAVEAARRWRDGGAGSLEARPPTLRLRTSRGP